MTKPELPILAAKLRRRAEARRRCLMTGSRALISDNYRINNDAGTYLFYAKLAASNERAGSFSTAEELWLKARCRAENELDRDWADKRAAVCRMKMTKWKVAA